MKTWTPIYEFYDIIDEIGVNRRQFPRASIKGSVVVRVADQTYLGQLATISEGGVGATQLPQLVSGHHAHIEIKSPHFANSINVKAIIQYVTNRGFVGFRFENIHMEAKSSIIEYVKSNNVEESDAA